MRNIKIVVVGNCQARPLAMAFEILSHQVEVSCVAIVHLLQSENFDEYRQCFEEADIIVAQIVSDNYPCNFVRTSFLKSEYGHKLISIVNLYFNGYTPDWQYVRIPGHGPLQGPMGDYHNTTVLKSWAEGLSSDEAVDRMLSKEFNKTYINAKTDSLSVLRQKEHSADVTITKYIEVEMSRQRLFFTFNHPCSALLVEYAKRILTRCGVYVDGTIHDLGGREPLGQFIPLVNPASELPSGEIKQAKGRECKFAAGKVTLGKSKNFQPKELVDCFYRIYRIYDDDVRSLISK